MKAESSTPMRYLVRSELMQGYTTASAFIANPSIESAINREGLPQVFSLGTDNDLYNLSPGNDAKAWQAFKMRVPAAVGSFAAGRNLPGDVVVFVAGTDNHVYWTSDRAFATWVDLGTPFGLDVKITNIRTGYDAEGVLMAMVLVQGGLYSGICQIRWNDEDNAWDYVTPAIPSGSLIHDFMPGSAGKADGAFVSGSFSSISSAAVAFFEVHRVVPIYANYREQTNDIMALCGTRLADGSTQVFGLDENAQPWMIAHPLSKQPNLQIATGGIKFACLRAAFDPQRTAGQLQLFGIATDGALYQMRRYPTSDGSGGLGQPDWGLPQQLGAALNVGANSLSICLDGKGAPQCFAVTATDQLVWFAQNENNEWDVRTIAIPYEGKLAEFASYSTEVSVTDAFGVPLPEQPLRVSTSASVRASINGKMFSVGPQNPVTCVSNAVGRLTLVVPTLTLGTPSITIEGGPVGGENLISIRPDQGTQEKINGPVSGNPATWEDVQATLLGAEVDGAPLIPAQYSGDQTVMQGVAKAVHGSLSLAQQAPGDVPEWSRVADTRGDVNFVRVLPRAQAHLSDAIDPQRVPVQHWRVHFSNQGPVFTALRNRDEAMSMVATLSTSAANFSLSQRPDWGTLWAGVRQGVIDLTNLVVTTLTEVAAAGKEIVTRIEAYIVTKAGQVYNYVVDKVQMAFDMVQGVLEEIEVKFTSMFQWLGTMFGWQDVLFVKNHVKALVLKALEAAPVQIKAVQSYVDEALGKLTADLDLGTYGNKSFGSDVQEANQKSAGKAPGPSANFVENELVNGRSGGPGLIGASITPNGGALAAIANFMVTVEQQLASRIPALWEEFRRTVLDGKQLSDMTPGEMLTAFGKLIASGLLSIAQTLIDAAFDLIVDLIEAVTDLLTHVWHVPVLSHLYKVIDPTGELTLLDLICLAMAVPTTLTMKALGKTFPAVPPGDLIVTLTPGQLFGTEKIDVTTKASLQRAGLLKSEEGDGEVIASTILGYCFSFGLLFQWGINSVRFGLGTGTMPLGQALRWLDATTRLISATASVVTWVIACDFFFVKPKTASQYVNLANFIVLGLQSIIVDVLPALVQGFAASSDSWVEKAMAYYNTTGVNLHGAQFDAQRAYVNNLRREAEASQGRMDRMEIVLNGLGFVFSGVLVGGYITQAVLEGEEEQNKTGAAKFFKVAAKCSQNLLTSVDHLLLPFTPLFRATPQGKALYIGATGLADLGAGTINAIRASQNIAVHFNK